MINFETLTVKPCGHDTGYRFCTITFKLHMKVVVDDEKRDPINFWVMGANVLVNIGPLLGDATLWVVLLSLTYFKFELHTSDFK